MLHASAITKPRTPRSVKRHQSVGGKVLLSDTSTFQRWNDLPYGMWTTDDGRAILYNRFYEPIRERGPDGKAKLSDSKEWVQGINSHRWFYNDGPDEKKKRKAAEAALATWNQGDIPPGDEP